MPDYLNMCPSRYGKMGRAKFAIIMTSDEYWDPQSPCKDEVQAILEKGLKIYNIRVDDTCHTCMASPCAGWFALRP